MNILVLWTSSSIILVSAEPLIAFAIQDTCRVECMPYAERVCQRSSCTAYTYPVVKHCTALVFWKDMICTSIPISVVRVRLRQDFTKFVVIIIAQLGIPGTIKSCLAPGSAVTRASCIVKYLSSPFPHPDFVTVVSFRSQWPKYISRTLFSMEKHSVVVFPYVTS